MTYIKAITSTLADAMRADERVFVLGEDVAEGGPYTATAGLAEEFGDRARDQHADQRSGDHRRRDRSSPVGHASGARDHVHRLHHARARPARQRRREGAFHVRRPADRADGVAHPGRRRLSRRGAALAEPGELAHARARPQGRDAEPPERRCRAPRERDRGSEPRRLHREQDALLPDGRRARSGRARADRRGRHPSRGQRRHRRRPLAPRARCARGGRPPRRRGRHRGRR